jgi:hypothetical protein
MKYQPAKTLQRAAACRKTIVQQRLGGKNLDGTIQRGRCTHSSHSYDSDGYAFQIQEIAIPNSIGVCNHHKQISGQLYVACSRVGKPNNLYIFTDNGTTKNIVYQQALRHYSFQIRPH